MNENSEDDTNTLLRLGSEFIGSTGGTLIGLTITGGPGALVGASLTPLISEFSRRLLTSRQKARVGATVLLAKQKINMRIQNGDSVSERFFTSSDEDRSSADEVWEAIALYSQQEYEERKIIYYANLMANLAFEGAVDSSRGNFLLKLANNLTYRQLCLISVYSNTHLKTELRQTDYRGLAGGISEKLVSILHETLEISNYGVVSLPGDTLLGLTDVCPARMHVQGAGRDLYRLMELSTINQRDIQKIVGELI